MARKTEAPPSNALTYQPESAHLECRMGGSDKVYNVELSQSEAGWTCDCYSGPRGSTLTHQKPKAENTDYETAKREFDKVVATKLKGHDGTHYSYAGGTSPAVASQGDPGAVAHAATATSLPSAGLSNCRGAVSAEVLFAPELLTRIDESEAERYEADDRYIFQNKEDADRLAVQVEDGKIFGYNKSGQAVALDTQLHAAIARLCELTGIERLLLDGEWEPIGLVAWDILEFWTNGQYQDMRPYPYRDRLALLETLFANVQAITGFSAANSLLHVVESARTTEAKRAMRSNRFTGDTKVREGICVKDLDAPYKPGRNGQHKKFKFEQSASLIVGPKPGRKATDGKRSVGLYIIDPDSRDHATWIETAWRDWWKSEMSWPNRIRFVCTAKVADRYAVPAIGSIVEVRYVAAYRATGGIEQPQLSWEGHDLKVRTDVRVEECTTGQLKYKTPASPESQVASPEEPAPDEPEPGDDGDDPKDWNYEVLNGDTNLSYPDWLEHKRAIAEDDAAATKEPGETEPRIVTVAAARLASGTYDHALQKEVGEGDIAKSYSGDTICAGKIRGVITLEGKPYVTTGMAGRGLTATGTEQASLWPLLTLAEWGNRPTTTYSEMTARANHGPDFPPFTYEGIKVKRGKLEFVMGPRSGEITAAADMPVHQHASRAEERVCEAEQEAIANGEEPEESELHGDDLCDLCHSSDVHVERTTYCGQTIGIECGCDEDSDGTCGNPECEECKKGGDDDADFADDGDGPEPDERGEPAPEPLKLASEPYPWHQASLFGG